METEKSLQMNPAARRLHIAELLHRQKTVDVRELSRALFVNEATIRRDLNRLATDGIARRTHGGAVLLEGLDTEIPFYARETENGAAKDSICHRAAEMVRDGDALMLDSSSTVLRMLKYLNRTKLKIITNGAKTALLAARLPEVSVYCTGGKMRENSLSYIGQSALDYVRDFHVDLLFFSCRCVCAGGLSDPSEEEALLRRAMLRASAKSVLLADASKLGGESFFRICGLNDVDEIICDAPAALAQMKREACEGGV